MMRKIIILGVFFSLLLTGSFIIRPAFAACSDINPMTGLCEDSRSPVDCLSVTGINICCGTSAECPTSYPTPTTAPAGPCPGLTGTAKTDCEDCVTNKHGAYTALGCVPTKPEEFVQKLLSWAIGLAGGIAFLLILYGGFQIVTSSGDPEKLNNGKDIIVSAMAGVLMIVFSVLLLRIIGVDILQIPGFKK